MRGYHGFLLLLWLFPASFASASTDQPSNSVDRAIRLSSLTGKGAQPFHLKLTVSEPANPSSPYTATIEESWISASDWQRSIESPGFREHITVTAGKREEQNVGDYYPLWLRSFVTASLDPLEDAPFWQQVGARVSQITSTNGHASSSCARAQFKIGAENLTNDAFAVICFDADGTLSSVVRPGYSMEFHDPQAFGKKRIASRYVDHPEPGTELVGHVELLEKLNTMGSLPPLPTFTQPASGPIRSISIRQEVLENLAITPTSLSWPKVSSGNTAGKLSMYVSVDRSGRIREAYPLNSDNAGLQDAAREQLLKWKLKAAVVDGQRVQTEAAVTFGFSTTLDGITTSAANATVPDSAPSRPIVVSPAVAQSLRKQSYPPVYPQDLKEQHVSGKVELKAILGKEGQIVSLTPLNSPDPRFAESAIAAVQQWTYKPFMLNGSPVEIETVITVNFQAH